MPVFDYQCSVCGNIEERIIFSNSNYREILVCSKCGAELVRIFPQKSPTFKLVFNNKRGDMCDWDGNTNHYYDEYKKQKADGKDVRIPELEGEK
jgi:putative FmdB family regulatory protein